MNYLRPGTYDQMTDEAVLACARSALTRAMSLPATSSSRRVEQQRFDSAMLELSRRAINHVLAKLRELEQPEEV